MVVTLLTEKKDKHLENVELYNHGNKKRVKSSTATGSKITTIYIIRGPQKIRSNKIVFTFLFK